MQLTTYVVIWSFLAAIVLALGLIRYLVSLHGDGNIHISAAQERLIPKQMAIFSKLDALDRWGKTLTIVALAGGLALAALYFNQIFRQPTTPGLSDAPALCSVFLE